MTGLLRTTLFATLLAASAAAQTGSTPVETPPVPLSPEKQAVVKQHVQRAKPPDAQTDGPVTVGMTVPESVELWSLPQDSVTEVPSVTSYKFLMKGKTIAVVDPESRKVVQIIPN
ncbi:hypothetical protein AA309_27150 [Microvirga vignae]|uniref:DUF1236 domain-containing protein n=1 Tax=Microvirga vignae TaxID=1225564 RepID=A0A0H1R523_9HYPH|nr:DUF1236 domain-containing protein [Microvirga vignae]KLK90189.1 hypothetical protein AA309_27150 [Microvirga vignae]